MVWSDIFFYINASSQEVCSANRQNWRYWSEENPHIVDEINNQGGKSFMCSVMMVDGRILEPYWFVTEEGKAFNCDQHAYLDMLEQHFFLNFLLASLGNITSSKMESSKSLSVQYLDTTGIC